MPCYTPWYAFLEPGTEPYEEARRRVEAMAESMQRVIDAYLQMHEIEPPRGRIDMPQHPETVRLRPFDASAMSTELLHRIAQHCVCDEVGYSTLSDIASVWDDAEPPLAVYRAIARDAARAIRRGLPLRAYDREANEAESWAYRRLAGRQAPPSP